MSTVTLRRRSNGVASILFDTPRSPVNLLSRELFDQVEPLLEEIEGDPAIVACVLESAKPGTFVAGADLEQIEALGTPEDGESFSRRGQAVAQRVAASPKPFVAAVWGPALGGGLELALACRRRVAAAAAETVLALPEVTLGLLPAGGGTQRLPRLVGLRESLPLLLTGRRLRALAALRIGLVDEIVSPEALERAAVDAAASLAAGTRPRAGRRRSIASRLLERAGRSTAIRTARAQVLHRTRGLYPAPLAVLECVRTGYERGLRAGFDREAASFGRLAAGRPAKRLLRLFVDTRALRKPLEGPEPPAVRRVAIVGAGFMGTGIAAVSLAHAEVVLRDVSEQRLAGSVAEVRQGLEKRARDGSISAEDAARLAAQLHTTLEARDLASADLVIEAVFEDLELKRRVLREIEDVIAPTAVFASNTSALPIASIAEGAARPERVLGMHYFSPVPKMELVEIVTGPATSARALATARAFAIRQGKTVVVVRDGPGFYTSRVLSPYLNEALILLEEGARVEEVDRALQDFGFPVGPLTLLDEVGIDVAARVYRRFGQLYHDRGLGQSHALERLHEAGYEGRKNGRGFYRYDRARRKRGKAVNEEVYAALRADGTRRIEAAEIAERCVAVMANEAVYALQEGIVACPRDGDVAAVLGLGFPAVRGGPFRHLDDRGIAGTVEVMTRLSELGGARFVPAPLLGSMARDGAKFYAR
jgi:3-hydroxyacyl-CoA dehydrogenase/enoyl-CoA hydratase/3-hydroxybutyryl-CoA epimerase